MDQITNESLKTLRQSENRSRWLGWSSFVFAFLQSVCTFVVATSSIRILISLSSLGAAVGGSAAVKSFHQDAIRIPMLIFAVVGALINLFAVWQLRRLRNRSASQWRMQPVSASQKRSEWLQIALAVVTLILVIAEWQIHAMLHRPH